MLNFSIYPLRPFFFTVLVLLFHTTFSQETGDSDSVSIIALNDPTVPDGEKTYSSGGEIIKKKKDSKIKNSLTKREIFIQKGKNSFRFKYGGRIQTRFDLTKAQEPGAKIEDDLYFRRVRFKSDGHFFNPKFGYKLEIDIIGAQILDAYLKWNFYKNFELWAGQTKLRGNRERVISSQNLQFVDRSLLNARFTLDRDMGVWLLHHFKAGQGVWRQALSVSKG